VALLFRLAFFSLSTGGFARVYYLEFLDSLEMSIDPWTNWIDSGGRSDALPYGLVLFTLLFLVHLTSAAISSLIGIESFVITYALILISCDFMVAKVLRLHSTSKASLIYLFSPLVIYVNVIYLQTDAFIGLFMLLASVLLVQRRTRLAGIFLGLAVGSKFGLVIVFPFLIIYAVFNKRIRYKILEVLSWSTAISLLSYIPSLWSEGFRRMVFGTSESLNLVEVSIAMGGRNFYLFPAVYVAFCFWVYKNYRSGLFSVVGFTGCVMFSLALYSESAVGWFLWGMATMVYVGVFTKIGAGVIFFIVQIAVVFRDITFGNLKDLGYGLDSYSSVLSNGFYTFTLVLGSIWTLSVLRESNRLSDPLSLIERPLSIVVAGDSGVGKDTLVESIAEIVGQECITVIPGDGYHKHERGHLKWSVNTHLNPLENYLEEWNRNFQRALQREDIYTRNYDHSNGRFEYLSGAKPRDLIISQGLHSFYGMDGKKVDVKLFLEMEAELRLRFKIKRDSLERGHTKKESLSEIKKRKNDYKNYVEIQREKADLIVRQECTKRNALVIDTILVQTIENSLADFLYANCVPFVPSIKYRKRENDSQHIVIQNVDLIGSSTMKCVLKHGFEQINDYFPKDKNPRSGSAGLVSVLTLLAVAYKRSKTN